MVHRRALPFVGLVLMTACEAGLPTTPRPSVARTTASLSLDSGPTESCTGLIIGGSFHNVVVPEGASCILVSSTLTGSLVALPGSSLQTSGNNVAGNIEIESAQSVRLSRDIVEGDVLIDRNTGSEVSTSSYLVAGVTLTHGDILVTNNSNISVNLRSNDVLEGSIRVIGNENTSFTLIANRVAQDVFVLTNRGPTGKLVRSTTAGHMILCEANDDPFVTSENNAPKLKGQCAAPEPAG